MNAEQITALRYRSEGTDVDFKAAQYRFIRATEDAKAEMLKDVLAIANAWREGEGYILLGFKENRPHPAEIVGITEHLDDASVQQFVHGKVKPKLTFRYEEHVYEGHTVGVISIPKQKRPFYLAHAYGKLKSNVVYVRRGSATDEAEPPEAAAMVAADERRGRLQVRLGVLTPNNDELPETVELRYLEFSEKFPDYESPQQARGFLDPPSLAQDNRHFWREAAEYAQVQCALVQLRFVRKRLGNTSCPDAWYQLVVVAGIQLCGSNSPMRLAGWVGSRSRTSLRYR